jgi:hypothetical protein
MQRLWERLSREGLLKPDAEPLAEPRAAGRAELELELRWLCDRGVLEGGLSIALDVRPDEAFGAVCVAIGGNARGIRVVDVRYRPVPELRLRLGENEERWEVEDLHALVHNLNQLLADDPAARAVAILGEWEDALQLWCVPKAKLRALLRADYFAPHNRRQLESLADR